MPELPEVETVRLQLLHKIKGRKIKQVKVLNSKTVGNKTSFAKKLAGKSFANIDRIGKLMIFSFLGEDDLFLLAHLKMTGQFFFADTKEVTGGGHRNLPNPRSDLGLGAVEGTLPHKHTRVIFEFNDKTFLYFNDMRKFGYIKLANRKEVDIAKARFGQELISEDFDLGIFGDGLARRKTPIKAALLDQTFVAGLGNIYVDEALFLAKVRPDRLANTINAKEAKLLAKHSGEVMKKSISVGGTTFQHFADTGGQAGNYSDFLKVFGKQNTPCQKCKTIIKKVRVAGRGTHYCPTCQK